MNSAYVLNVSSTCWSLPVKIPFRFHRLESIFLSQSHIISDKYVLPFVGLAANGLGVDGGYYASSNVFIPRNKMMKYE